MPVQLTIETSAGDARDGLEAFAQALQRAEGKVRRLNEEAYPALLPVLEQTAAQQIDRRRPRSGTYAAYARAHFPGWRPLVKSGAFRAAMTSAGGNARRDVGGGELEFGTRGVFYASFLAFKLRPSAKSVKAAFERALEQAIKDADPAGILGQFQGEELMGFAT